MNKDKSIMCPKYRDILKYKLLCSNINYHAIALYLLKGAKENGKGFKR